MGKGALASSGVGSQEKDMWPSKSVLAVGCVCLQAASAMAYSDGFGLLTAKFGPSFRCRNASELSARGLSQRRIIDSGSALIPDRRSALIKGRRRTAVAALVDEGRW